MRLCSRGKQTLMTALGPIAYSYWAKRRALNSALLSTIVFHALQDSLKLWISNKRSWVSNAVSAPISTFAAPTNKFGTKTVNCTSLSRYNTSGSITWDWRNLPHPYASSKHTHSSYEWSPEIRPTLYPLEMKRLIQTNIFIQWIIPKNVAYPSSITSEVSIQKNKKIHNMNQSWECGLPI